MTFLDMIAGVGIIVADLAVVIGLVGALFFLLTTLLGKSPRALPERIKLWAVGGNFFALILLSALYVSNTSINEIGFLFRMPVDLVRSLLTVSLFLILESRLLRQRKKAHLHKLNSEG